MPGRSTTCPRSLEDLLIGAGARRTSELLKRVDKAVETQSKLSLAHILTEPEVLPVPVFAVRETAGQEGIRKTRTHSHGSDSGIGTSIAGSEEAIAPTGELQHPAYSRTKLMCHCILASPSTPTQSFSGISAVTEERGLSKYACEQIHKHIVQPILREQQLKDFHPLIKDVPSKIGKKEIKNLRDLEQTLIFLAPVSPDCVREQSDCAFTYGCFGVKDFSRSHIKYLQFCERTIRVLHTTVTTLHESDQRAPADRAYTQGYFLDLVEQVRFGSFDELETAVNNIILQIRRYAQILAATREKKANGEDTDEMDHST